MRRSFALFRRCLALWQFRRLGADGKEHQCGWPHQMRLGEPAGGAADGPGWSVRRREMLEKCSWCESSRKSASASGTAAENCGQARSTRRFESSTSTMADPEPPADCFTRNPTPTASPERTHAAYPLILRFAARNIAPATSAATRDIRAHRPRPSDRKSVAREAARRRERRCRRKSGATHNQPRRQST